MGTASRETAKIQQQRLSNESAAFWRDRQWFPENFHESVCSRAEMSFTLVSHAAFAIYDYEFWLLVALQARICEFIHNVLDCSSGREIALGSPYRVHKYFSGSLAF